MRVIRDSMIPYTLFRRGKQETVSATVLRLGHRKGRRIASGLLPPNHKHAARRRDYPFNDCFRRLTSIFMMSVSSKTLGLTRPGLPGPRNLDRLFRPAARAKQVAVAG